MSKPHLLIALSAHGYGHFSQVAPVINSLMKRLPELELTFRTTLPADVIAARVPYPFARQNVADDFGMLMHNAIDVDVAASLERYKTFHADWPRLLHSVADDLKAAKPDLVLADAPYLTLAGARQAHIPAVALCSLNWADVLDGYADAHARREIVPRIAESYAAAQCFMQPMPSMDMPRLQSAGVKLQPVGALGCPGVARAEELRLQLGLAGDVRLVLVGMGGMPFNVSTKNWPETVNGEPLHYLLPPGWDKPGTHATFLSDVPLSYSDVLASVDLIITKPGYGMFVEAVAAGVPVIYVERDDWPDTLSLESWIAQHGRAVKVSREGLTGDELYGAMPVLLSAGRHAPVIPAGGAEVSVKLQAMLC